MRHRQLRGYVLPTNRPMLALCRRKGATVSDADGVLQTDIPFR
jgi:hypothetical protein